MCALSGENKSATMRWFNDIVGKCVLLSVFVLIQNEELSGIVFRRLAITVVFWKLLTELEIWFLSGTSLWVQINCWSGFATSHGIWKGEEFFDFCTEFSGNADKPGLNGSK